METTYFIRMILMLGLTPSLYITAIPTFSNQTDLIALFAFKDSITEDPLGALSSWNNSVNLCQWHGVKCGGRHQRVVELDLRSQKLAGPISPFIGNLSFLKSIYLQDNLFRGSIPREISHLSRLQNLNFSFNTLEEEILSNLSLCLDIQVIDLGKNGCWENSSSIWFSFQAHCSISLLQQSAWNYPSISW
ncbi:hypothetical protein QYF36_005326 [Acer negundo]|nr:hypothetical protein QYF36_005326 [Acer negundo]